MSKGSYVSRCVLSACLLSTLAATASVHAHTLKIDSLTLANAYAIEHYNITGDDRGGIAYGGGKVYYTGDTRTGAFTGGSLASPALLPRVYDGMFSTFSDGKVYTLVNGSNYSNASGFTGVETMGAPASRVTLSSSILSGERGIMFSGYDAGYFWNSSTRDVFKIDPRTGARTRIGNVALAYNGAENWAAWGVAEYFGEQDYLTYASGNQIKRTRISDGATTSLLTASLSDIASFTIAPDLNKWFFHYEGIGAVRAGDETIASADAVITMTRDVPEPASLALVAIGLAGVAGLRRRRVTAG